MIERRIVRRYAAALFHAARKADVVDRIESDLGLASYVLETSHDPMGAISSPLVAPDKKKSILTEIFADKVNEITLQYMHLLVDKRREEALLTTEREYVLLANEARGIMDAEVTTAVKLDEDQESDIESRLSAMTGKSIHLVKNIDPGIIGGVVVKIGDTLIDGSIRGQLAALREKLLS